MANNNLNNSSEPIMMLHMDHYTIFISDLHLNQTTQKTADLFLKFAEEIVQQPIDGIYILGDLFRFWGGDDDHSMFNTQIKTILKKISDKIPVYLMAGNRDFLLGEEFAKESGCTLISDPCSINLYGKTTVLTHGDILCTNDIKYRMFRAVIRIPHSIKLFLKLPLAIRLWLASNAQKYSAKTKPLKNQNTLAVQPDTVKKLLTKFNSTQIIHGHIHIEETEEIVMSTQKARRISLGEWDNKANILIYHGNHCFEFKN